MNKEFVDNSVNERVGESKVDEGSGSCVKPNLTEFEAAVAPTAASDFVRFAEKGQVSHAERLIKESCRKRRNRKGVQRRKAKKQYQLVQLQTEEMSEVVVKEEPFVGPYTSGSENDPENSINEQTLGLITSGSNQVPQNSSLVCEEFRQAIISESYPGVKLSNDQFDVIRLALAKEIDVIQDDNLPRFENSFIREGAVIVDCTDEWSREWLADRVHKLNLFGDDHLQVVDLPNLQKIGTFHRAVVQISEPFQSIEIFFSAAREAKSRFKDKSLAYLS